MQKTLHILLLAKDASLAKELEGTLGDLPEDMRLVIHAEADTRRGIEHALNRNPDAVFLELDENLDEVRRTATEIHRQAAGTAIAAIYRPQVLGGDDRSAAILIELMRAGVKDFLRRPLATSELEDLLRRHFWNSERKQGSRGRIISFIGNKGGVGKSTLSLSTACGLAREAPGQVLLIDASLQQGSMCELLDIEAESTLSDVARQIDRLDERLLRMMSVAHPCGLRVLAAPPNAIDAAPVDDQALARILAVARQAFDYVIVDTFPLIDSVTIAILDVADFVFVVLNDLVPAVIGTADLLEVLDRLGVDKERIRVVLNHSQGAFRGRLKGVDVATRLGHDLDYVIPFSRRVLVSTNVGEPYALNAPRWIGFGKAMLGIEREILTAGPRTSAVEDEPDERPPVLREPVGRPPSEDELLEMGGAS